jgi:hypothetical protein
MDVCWHFTHLPPRFKIFDVKRFTKTYSEQVKYHKFEFEIYQPLSTADLGPLFWALRFNSYFQTFQIKNTKLDKESFLDLVETFKYNKDFEEMIVSGVGGTKEGFVALFEGIANNKGCSVTKLDVSNNNVEDKGLTALANLIQAGVSNPIVSLNLTNINVGKGWLISILSEGFQLE